jgi:hypothetical protein
MTTPTSNPIARELNDFWSQTQSLAQQFWYEADLDTKFTVGMQDYQNYFYGTNYQNRKQLVYNKILRLINMVGGYQRDHRLQSVIQAADNDPDMGETADMRSTVLNWVMDQDRTYHKISDCFEGSNVCGQNLLSIWMDFREDPENGKICTSRLPFSSYIMDPYWTKKDLSDCGRIWTRKYLTKQHLEAIFPGVSNEVPSLQTGYASMDGKFQYLAQNWYQYNVQMYAYDEYFVQDYKVKRKLLDTKSGEVAPWNGTKEQFQLLMRINPNVKLIKARVPTIKHYVLVNNNLMYEEQSPWGLDRMPFGVSVAYMFPEVQNYAYRFFGLVRNIRDPQIETNRRRNRLLDMLDAQVQSGMAVKENALVNPEDGFMQGPGRVMFFKNSANLATDMKEFMPPPVGQGWLELIQSIEKEIMDIVGPEELFAQNMGNKEMSAILLKQKMAAGLVGLKSIFDNLEEFQLSVAQIQDDLVVNNFSEGKVAHILGRKPSEHFFDKEFQKFNCKIVEGEMTETQRSRKLLEAIQLKQLIPDAISDDYILSLSSLQDKKQLMEISKQRSQQAAQMQQAQAQQAMQQQEMLSRSLEAKAQSDFAGAEEKKARAVSDFGLARHHMALAAQDVANSQLTTAKAMKEFDEIDENRLMKLADFIISVQERQNSMQMGQEEAAIAGAKMNSAEVSQAEQSTRPKQEKQQEQMQAA